MNTRRSPPITRSNSMMTQSLAGLCSEIQPRWEYRKYPTSWQRSITAAETMNDSLSLLYLQQWRADTCGNPTTTPVLVLAGGQGGTYTSLASRISRGVGNPVHALAGFHNKFGVANIPIRNRRDSNQIYGVYSHRRASIDQQYFAKRPCSS